MSRSWSFFISVSPDTKAYKPVGVLSAGCGRVDALRIVAATPGIGAWPRHVLFKRVLHTNALGLVFDFASPCQFFALVARTQRIVSSIPVRERSSHRLSTTEPLTNPVPSLFNGSQRLFSTVVIREICSFKQSLSFRAFSCYC